MRGTRERGRNRLLTADALQAKRFQAIQAMRPYAWYDANVGGTSDGMPDISGNDRDPIVNGAGSNAALFLPYTDEPGAYSPGGADNIILTSGLSLPSAAGATSFTIEADVTLPAYTGADQVIAWQTGETFVRILSSGAIDVIWFDSSTTYFNVATTSPYAFVAGQRYVIKVKVTNAGVVSFWVDGAVVAGGSVVGANGFIPGTTGSLTCGVQSAGINATGVRHSLQLSYNDVAVARFDAALCTQSSYVDDYGNAWAIGRAATGRKTVVQSPAAYSAESLFLLGTDDRMTVPAASLPPMGKTAGNWTALFIYRMWPTPGGYAAVWGRRQSGGGLHGFYDHNISNTNTTSLYSYDGTTERNVGAVAWTNGIRNVASFRYDVATTTKGLSINGGIEATASIAAANAFDVSATDMLIGAHPAGYNNDMEFRGCIFFDRVITATERSLINVAYKAGL